MPEPWYIFKEHYVSNADFRSSARGSFRRRIDDHNHIRILSGKRDIGSSIVVVLRLYGLNLIWTIPAKESFRNSFSPPTDTSRVQPQYRAKGPATSEKGLDEAANLGSTIHDNVQPHEVSMPKRHSKLATYSRNFERTLIKYNLEERGVKRGAA